MRDSDPTVRRRCVEAIGLAAAGLCKLVLATQSSEAPEELSAYQRQLEEEAHGVVALDPHAAQSRYRH